MVISIVILLISFSDSRDIKQQLFDICLFSVSQSFVRVMGLSLEISYASPLETVTGIDTLFQNALIFWECIFIPTFALPTCSVAFWEMYS